MDRLLAMNVFVAVADARGFAPAARRCGLSPSAVTRLVAGLEDHLGTRLLERTTRAVTLTDAGSRYLERTRRILNDVSEAEGAAQAERQAPVGRLVVTAPLVFGRLHVAPLMCRYMETFAAVRGELMLNDRNANLVDDGIDLAVRIGALEDSSLVSKTVGATRKVVCASPKYLKKHPKLKRPDDVAGHDVIQCTALTPLPEWRFIDDGEVRRVPLHPRYVTNSADAAIGHAERHGGLTQLLAYQVKDAVAADRLRVVLADFETPALPIHVVHPSTRLLSAKVRAFIDLLASTCDWHFTEI